MKQAFGVPDPCKPFELVLSCFIFAVTEANGTFNFTMSLIGKLIRLSQRGLALGWLELAKVDRVAPRLEVGINFMSSQYLN